MIALCFQDKKLGVFSLSLRVATKVNLDCLGEYKSSFFCSDRVDGLMTSD